MGINDTLSNLVLAKKVVDVKVNKEGNTLNVLIAFSSEEERNIFSDYIDKEMMRRAMLMRSSYQAWISLPLGSNIHKKFLEARKLQPNLMD